MISFHRGDIAAARRHLADGDAHVKQIGTGSSPLALARSLDCERAGALPEALAALTEVFADAEELEGSRTCSPTPSGSPSRPGDLATAQALAGHAAALAAGSEIPHRQANALYCRGLLDHDAAPLLAAADRYEAARRPLLSARRWRPPPASSSRADDREPGPGRLSRAVEIYTSLGAAADVPGCLPGSARRESGSARTPGTGGR